MRYLIFLITILIVLSGCANEIRGFAEDIHTSKRQSAPEFNHTTCDTNSTTVKGFTTYKPLENRQQGSLKLIKSDGFNNYITGLVSNNSGEYFDFVKVNFVIYDSKGNKLGNAFDTIRNLNPGDSWKFKAYVNDSEFSSYAFEGFSF